MPCAAAETSRAGTWTPVIVLVAVAAILLRSWFFLVWEEAYFDSDQAIVGLMAKHLSEGRAWPLFFYGQQYMLAVESWLMAPVFWLFGSSVFLLRMTMVAINLGTGLLLWRLLVTDARLHPWAAALAASPFWLAPFVASAHLIEAQGGNVEPFLWVLVLWMLRQRPLVLGGVMAVAFLNREFSLYAAPAMLVVQLVEARGRVRDLVRPWVMTAVTFVLVVAAVAGLESHADLLGPGSAGIPLAGQPSSSVWLLLGRVNFDPAAMPERLRALGGDYLPLMFGLQDLRPSLISIWTDAHVGWPALLPVVAVAAAVCVALLARDLIRRPGPMAPAAFPAFLAMVALQSGLAYAVSRAPGVSSFKYGLLVLFLPIGVGALLLQAWRSAAVRAGGAIVLGLLAAGSAVDHAWVIHFARTSPPPVRFRAVADRLVERGVTVACADYWRAYAITFLTGERVKVATTDLIERIREYQVLAFQSGARPVRLSTTPCLAGESSELVGQWFLCQ